LWDFDLVNGSVGVVVGFRMPSQVRASMGWTKDNSSSEPPTRIASDLEPTADENSHMQPMDNEYEENSWPVVQYTHGARVMMGPVKFTYEGPDGEEQASRQQVCRTATVLVVIWVVTQIF
jgi:hypothetical protein